MSASALQPRPAVEPPARWRFPVPQRHRLDNGVTVSCITCPASTWPP